MQENGFLASLTDEGHLYYIQIQSTDEAQELSIQLTQVADIKGVDRIHIAGSQNQDLSVYLLSDPSTLIKANIFTR